MSTRSFLAKLIKESPAARHLSRHKTQAASDFEPLECPGCSFKWSSTMAYMDGLTPGCICPKCPPEEAPDLVVAKNFYKSEAKPGGKSLRTQRISAARKSRLDQQDQDLEELVQGVASGKYDLNAAHAGVRVPRAPQMQCDSCCQKYTPKMHIHRERCPKCGCTDVFVVESEAAPVHLIAKDGMLYIPGKYAQPGSCQAQYNPGEDIIVLVISGEPATVNWPNPNLDTLVTALYDAREVGDLPKDTASVFLPDGKKFTIDTGEISESEAGVEVPTEAPAEDTSRDAEIYRMAVELHGTHHQFSSVVRKIETDLGHPLSQEWKNIIWDICNP